MLEAVAFLCNPIGIALHGSRTRGTCDLFSDIDVLVLVRGAVPSREYRVLGGFGLDLLAGTPEQFRALLEAQPHTRDFEVTLNASISAVRVYDPEGAVAELHAFAKEVWERGPQPLSKREVAMAHARLLRLLHSAERFVIRSERDPSHALAGVIRCDYLVVEAVYHHFRKARRWTIDLPKLLQQLYAEGAELGDLCKQYASAPTSKHKLNLARQIYHVAASTGH